MNNLRPGTKSLNITCLDDGGNGNDIGTLGIALNDGVAFESGETTLSAEVALGQTVTYRIIIPSSSRSKEFSPRIEPPKNLHPRRGK